MIQIAVYRLDQKVETKDTLEICKQTLKELRDQLLQLRKTKSDCKSMTDQSERKRSLESIDGLF